MTIRVRAKARGFYGKLREVDEEFSVEGKDDLGTWMEPIKDEPKPKAGAKPGGPASDLV
jgi:hypothetical protein